MLYALLFWVLFVGVSYWLLVMLFCSVVIVLCLFLKVVFDFFFWFVCGFVSGGLLLVVVVFLDLCLLWCCFGFVRLVRSYLGYGIRMFVGIVISYFCYLVVLLLLLLFGYGCVVPFRC